MTRLTLTLASLIAVLIVTLMPVGHVFSQNLPPGPTVVYQTTFSSSGLSGEFDLVSRVLEFAPGSATPFHTHGGLGTHIVLEGEIYWAAEGKAEQTVTTGGTWTELPGEYYIAGNRGTTKARVSFVVALPKGGTLTAPKAGTPGANPPPGPTVVYSATLPGLTMPGEFELTNLILDFAPGSATPSHTHGGPGLVTVLEGEMSNATEGMAEQTVKVGQSWAELPGEYAVVSNKGTTNARVSFAIVLPKGAALTTVRQAATATAVPQPPTPVVAETPVSVGMPSTGAGNTMSWLVPALVFSLLCLALGVISRSRRTTNR